MCPINRQTCARTTRRPLVQPTLAMPAMPPLGLFARLAALRDRYRCRRELRRLLSAGDHRLDDLGHCRATLEAALATTRLSGNPCAGLELGGD